MTSTAAQPSLHGANENTVTGLTPPQTDGLACVLCGTACLDHPVPHRTAGRSTSGPQTFACPHRVLHTVAGVFEGPGR